jgi:hypothetical protein
MLHYKDQSRNAVREIIAVCCEDQTKHTNTLVRKMYFHNVEACGTYSYH